MAFVAEDAVQQSPPEPMAKNPDVGAEKWDDGQSYYQRSIRSILRTVVDSHDNILEGDERALLRRIEALEGDAQRLLFRMYLRRSGWFRVEKLEYQDISDRGTAVASLQQAQLVDCSIADAEELLEILQLDELRLVAKELGVKYNANRQQVKEAILATRRSKQQRLNFSAKPRKPIAEEADERIVEFGSGLCGPLIRIQLDALEHLRRIFSLFFLTSSLEDDASASLTLAILTDLNRRKYPLYCILRSRPIFPDRQAWRAFDDALQYEKSLGEMFSDPGEQGIEQGFVLNLVVTVREGWRVNFSDEQERDDSYFLRRYTAGWVYTRILSSLVGVMEKLKLFAEANGVLEELLGQDFYCRGCRGRWWERLALNWARHLGSKAEALRRCEEGLADEHVRSGSRLALQRRLAKLNSQEFTLDELPRVITIYADPEDKRVTGRKLLYLLPGDVLGSVEELALAHFQEEGWAGFHCESRVLKFIYTLCFWDIIFAQVPDVFQSPYQGAPLDLTTDAFYKVRQEKIECRLEELRGGRGPQILVDVYYPFYGCQAVGVMWEACPLGALLDICASLGGEALAALLRPFAEDYANSSSGIPDLLLYRPDRSDYLLVEVKSTNDRLSDAQRNWNAIFRKEGIRVALCRVLDTSEQDKPSSKVMTIKRGCFRGCLAEFMKYYFIPLSAKESDLERIPFGWKHDDSVFLLGFLESEDELVSLNASLSKVCHRYNISVRLEALTRGVQFCFANGKVEVQRRLPGNGCTFYYETPPSVRDLEALVPSGATETDIFLKLYLAKNINMMRGKGEGEGKSLGAAGLFTSITLCRCKLGCLLRRLLGLSRPLDNVMRASHFLKTLLCSLSKVQEITNEPMSRSNEKRLEWQMTTILDLLLGLLVGGLLFQESSSTAAILISGFRVVSWDIVLPEFSVEGDGGIFPNLHCMVDGVASRLEA